MNYFILFSYKLKEFKDKIVLKWIHSRWPHVVAMACPSTSRQHALHLISAVRYYTCPRVDNTCETKPCIRILHRSMQLLEFLKGRKELAYSSSMPYLWNKSNNYNKSNNNQCNSSSAKAANCFQLKNEYLNQKYMDCNLQISQATG